MIINTQHIALLIGGLTLLCGCSTTPVNSRPDREYVKTDTLQNLSVFYPQYRTIDFIVGPAPEESDTTILFCCTAAFTQKRSFTTDASIIAGPFTTGGKYHEGFKTPTSTGCFTYCNHTWQFTSDSIEHNMKATAARKGIGFSQMMLIPNRIPHSKKRKLFNFLGINIFQSSDGRYNVRPETHHYRALCEYNKELCIVEAIHSCTFPYFLSCLEKAGIQKAIYLDVGFGWSYAWYRTASNRVYRLHPQTTPFCSNWLVFRK